MMMFFRHFTLSFLRIPALSAIEAIFLILFLSNFSFAAEEAAPKPLPPFIKITLKEALEMAFASSHDIRQLKEEVIAAEARTDQSLSKFYPTVNVNASAGTFHDRQGEVPQPESERDRNQYDAKVVLNQNLFSGFSHWSGLDAAKADRDSAQKKLEKKIAEVRLGVIKSYFNIQLKLKELAAEKEIAELRRNQLSQVESKFSQGRATEVEKLRAEYAVKSQIPQMKTIESDLEKETLSFVQFLGLPLTQEFSLTDQLEVANKLLLTKPLPDIAVAFEVALRTNPELLGYDFDLAKLNSDIKVTSAKHLPSLDLALSSSTTASRRDEIGASGYRSYGGQVNLNIPVFSGLSSFSERHENQTKLNVLLEKKAAYREKLLEDIRRVYSTWNLENAKAEAEKANIELTDKAVSQSEALYASGRATLIDVLDSYSSGLQAKKNYAAAEYGRITALAELKFILGE